MADFLIKAQVSGDEWIGDVVEVRDDGGCPGGTREEDPNSFVIVKVLGLDYLSVLHYMEKVTDEASDPIEIHRRRFSIDNVMQSGETLAEALTREGYHVSGNVYQMTQQQAAAVLRDKK